MVIRLKQLLPVFIVFSVISLLTFSGRTFAIDYDVNAKISAAIATQPAVILQPVAGTTFTTEQTTVSGVCEITTPSQLVIINRNGAFAGSGACSAIGEFSIEITLVPGGNLLVARIRNVTNDFGPNSQTVQVSYAPPYEGQPVDEGDDDDVTESPGSPSQGTSGAPSGGAAPPASSSSLKLSTEDEVVIFRTNGEVVITILIEEGASPYDLLVNWGDGISERYNFDSPGKKQLRHTYSSSGDKSIRIAVTDELGRTVYLTLGAVASNQQSSTQKSSASSQPLAQKLSSYRGIIAGVVLVAGSAAGAVVISNAVSGLSKPTGAKAGKTTKSAGAKSKGVKRGKK